MRRFAVQVSRLTAVGSDFTVRFRHLSGSNSFDRWDWIDFKSRPPTTDARRESCHVYEDSIVIAGKLPIAERSRLLDPLILGSVDEAVRRGQSLALVRTRDAQFVARRKTTKKIGEQRDAYRRAAAQTSMLDKQLAELEPSPYEFRFRFEDDARKHDYESGDWETHAMFWNWRKKHGEEKALRHMNKVFNEDYPKRGMVFAVGNQAKRPKTWQLLGVIRLDEVRQGDLFG